MQCMEFFIFGNFSICDAYAMRVEAGVDGSKGRHLKYAKIISDNAHVRHSPRSCLKCQKLCCSSPRGSCKAELGEEEEEEE